MTDCWIDDRLPELPWWKRTDLCCVLCGVLTLAAGFLLGWAWGDYQHVPTETAAIGVQPGISSPARLPTAIAIPVDDGSIAEPVIVPTASVASEVVPAAAIP